MGVLSKLKSRMAGAPQRQVPNTKNKVADIKQFVGKRRDTIRVGSRSSYYSIYHFFSFLNLSI